MALSSSLVWEVRTTGSSFNGGAYSSGGTDYSQQNSPDVSALGTLSMASTGTTLTSSSSLFTSGHVGNIINIIAGTNFTTGRYEITGYTNGTTITIDRNATNGSAASGGTASIGGAVDNVSTIVNDVVAGNKVWMKAGTYSQSSTLTFPTLVATNSNWIEYEGYSTNRGDATTPVADIDGGGNALARLVYCGAPGSSSQYGYTRFKYINFTNVAKTSAYKAVECIGRHFHFFRCRFGSCGSHAWDSGAGWFNYAYFCEADDFSRSGVAGAGFYAYAMNQVIGCIAHNGRGLAIGFSLNALASCHSCFASDVYDGFYQISNTGYILNLISDCSAYNCTYGFRHNNSASHVHLRNFLAHSCTTGYASTGHVYGEGLYSYNCTTSSSLGSDAIYLEPASVTALSYDPYVDAANDDFSLNQRNQAINQSAEVIKYIVNSSESSFDSYRDVGPFQRRRRMISIGSS